MQNFACVHSLCVCARACVCVCARAHMLCGVYSGLGCVVGPSQGLVERSLHFMSFSPSLCIPSFPFPPPLGQSTPVQSPMTVGSSAATVLVGASGGTGYHIVAVGGPSCCRGRRSSLDRAPMCNRKWSPTAHSTWTGLRRLDHLAAAWIGRTLAVY